MCLLVGHSYGGPVVRNFAATYPNEVAGMSSGGRSGENNEKLHRGHHSIRLKGYDYSSAAILLPAPSRS